MAQGYHRMHMFKKVFLFTALLVSTYTITGCGNEDPTTLVPNTPGATTVQTGTGSGNAQTDTFKTIQTVNTEVSSALTKALQGAPAQALVDRLDATQSIGPTTYPCANGGNLSVSGNVTNDSGANSSFTTDLDFNCTDLDGTLSIQGNQSVDLQTSAFSFNYSLNGTIGGNGCSLSYNNFSLQVSVSGQTYNFVVNGSIQAACGANQVNCTFNNANLADAASDSYCQ